MSTALAHQPVQKKLPTSEMQLIDGNFSPSEAYDALACIIERNINFFKLQHLGQWEKDHDLCTKSIQQKLSDLNHCKDELKRLTAEARAEGYKLKVDTKLVIELVK